MRNKRQIEIEDFSNIDKTKGATVERFYNVNPTSGLKQSLGVTLAEFPMRDDPSYGTYTLDMEMADLTKLDRIAIFKQFFPTSGNTNFRILLYGDDKKLYCNEMFMFSDFVLWIYNLTFESAPITLAFKKDDLDAIIMASEDKMVIWTTNYSPYEVTDAPIITSMCMNDGVLFCTLVEPAFKLWYATDLRAENIGKLSSNSGYITLADELGYAKKVIAFNESVYVFRELGISKINFVKNEFSITQVYISRTQILTNTVSACGDVIMFCTKEGLYSFNGVKVTKTDVNIFDILNNFNGNAVAESFKNKYYLALKLDFNDGKTIQCESASYTNNALLVVDTLDYSYELVRGIDIKQLQPVLARDFERMLVIFNTGNVGVVGEIIDTSSNFDVSLPKYWLSGDLVDDYNVKLFTKLIVESDADIKFNLIYDGGTITFTTYQNGINEFCFKILSKQLKLEITSDSESIEVKKAVIDYYEYWHYFIKTIKYLSSIFVLYLYECVFKWNEIENKGDKMKNRLTNYNFWISIVSAVLLILQAFDIQFDIAYINEIVTAVLGLLVVIGIISDPTKSSTKTNSSASSVEDTTSSNSPADTLLDSNHNSETIIPSKENESNTNETANIDESVSAENNANGAEEVNAESIPTNSQNEANNDITANNFEVLIKQISSDLNKSMSELYKLQEDLKTNNKTNLEVSQTESSEMSNSQSNIIESNETNSQENSELNSETQISEINTNSEPKISKSEIINEEVVTCHNIVN